MRFRPAVPSSYSLDRSAARAQTSPQMRAQPRVRKASWLSSRLSQRIRRRRNQCVARAPSGTRQHPQQVSGVLDRVDEDRLPGPARRTGPAYQHQCQTPLPHSHP